MAVSLSRRGEVEPFHAMDVLAEANRARIGVGRDMAHSEQGHGKHPFCCCRTAGPPTRFRGTLHAARELWLSWG